MSATINIEKMISAVGEGGGRMPKANWLKSLCPAFGFSPSPFSLWQ
ncbi:hypothetical protein [Echinicola rosea]|nr:hypothetical protein [Echinicola rosea]